MQSCCFAYLTSCFVDVLSLPNVYLLTGTGGGGGLLCLANLLGLPCYFRLATGLSYTFDFIMSLSN